MGSDTTSVTRKLQYCDYLIGPSSLDPNSLKLRNPPDRGRGKVRAGRRNACVRRDSKSPASPDRFIPLRDSIDNQATPYRVGKDPQELSPEERLFRRRSPGEDPFTPKKTRQSKSATKAGRVFSPHFGPHLVNDSTPPGRSASTGARDATRRVSSGAIWAVGGTSAALGRRSTVALGGPRGLLANGTTAPMYAAKFLPQIRTSAEDRATYESRIALALDIDPAARILNNSNLLSIFERLPSPSSPEYEQLSPLVWKDNAWRRVERGQCKSLVFISGNLMHTKPHPVLDNSVPFSSIYIYPSKSEYLHAVLQRSLVVSLKHWPSCLFPMENMDVKLIRKPEHRGASKFEKGQGYHSSKPPIPNFGCPSFA